MQKFSNLTALKGLNLLVDSGLFLWSFNVLTVSVWVLWLPPTVLTYAYNIYQVNWGF